MSTGGWIHAALLALGLSLIPVPVRAVEPTDQEQLFIWELNRARNDPAAWAAEFGLDSMVGGDGELTDLLDVDPQPPLAVNELLTDSAVFHSTEMATNNYFGHQSQVNGDWPNKMARDAGYLLASSLPVPGGGFYSLPDTSNQIESIAGGYGPGAQDFTLAINPLIALIVDSGVGSLGHRTHLLGMTGLSVQFVEVGAGFASNGAATYRNYWSIHTGAKVEPETFLTGVVYADSNTNQLYDAGEGLADVTVSAGGMQAMTNGAGGFALLVGDGSHNVSCSGGAFQGMPTVRVAVAGANREVDCVSGVDGAFVDFTFVPEPAAWLLLLAAMGALRALRPRAAS